MNGRNEALIGTSLGSQAAPGMTVSCGSRYRARASSGKGFLWPIFGPSKGVRGGESVSHRISTPRTRLKGEKKRRFRLFTTVVQRVLSAWVLRGRRQ
ncbi:hypothetical protein B0H12DRAFT_1127102 [Mycena haematopus]|nr:hypothetical protein B0H12DRAFT_1127102 [Mycena haematopus]